MLEILDYPSVLHDIAIARLSSTLLRVVICHRKSDNNKVINLWNGAKYQLFFS